MLRFALRLAAIVLWCIVLFIGTCTVSVELLISDFFIHFAFNPHPQWQELLKLEFWPHDKMYFIQKLGHFSGFLILSLLLTNWGRNKSGLVLAFGYALLTEVLQLFFFRDGRLIDVGIDLAGIFLAYWLCRAWRHSR